MVRRFRRLTRGTLGLGSLVLCGSVGYSLYYLGQNEWKVTDSGLVRSGRAAMTVANIVVDYKRTMGSLTEGCAEYGDVMSKCHYRSAMRLQKLCFLNRGAYIKIGQHMSALDYILPPEYVDCMKVMCKDAPQSSLPDVRQVMREEWGVEPEEVFTAFDDKPIGSASLAQVYRATLKDGKEVAVKVQHPKVKAHSAVDLVAIELLVEVVDWLFPDFTFKWLADQSKINLPLELDFVNEARNCERVATMYKHLEFLKVPYVCWEWTTSRILTMEFCEGGMVSDREYMIRNDISVNNVLRNLTKLYSEMIFTHGYIHCDPHPGNILVKKTAEGDQLVLLDHGLYSTLTNDFRANYGELWLALLSADVKQIQHYSERLGCGKLYIIFAAMVTGRSWDTIVGGIKKKVTAEEQALINKSAANFVPEIMSVLGSVPQQMLLIFKSNDLLRGLESMLHTRGDVKSYLTMTSCCVRAVYELRRKHCNTWWRYVSLSLTEQVLLTKIRIYEMFLWFKHISSKLGIEYKK